MSRLVVGKPILFPPVPLSSTLLRKLPILGIVCIPVEGTLPGYFLKLGVVRVSLPLALELGLSKIRVVNPALLVILELGLSMARAVRISLLGVLDQCLSKIRVAGVSIRVSLYLDLPKLEIVGVAVFEFLLMFWNGIPLVVGVEHLLAEIWVAFISSLYILLSILNAFSPIIRFCGISPSLVCIVLVFGPVFHESRRTNVFGIGRRASEPDFLKCPE